MQTSLSTFNETIEALRCPALQNYLPGLESTVASLTAELEAALNEAFNARESRAQEIADLNAGLANYVDEVAGLRQQLTDAQAQAQAQITAQIEQANAERDAALAARDEVQRQFDAYVAANVAQAQASP